MEPAQKNGEKMPEFTEYIATIALAEIMLVCAVLLVFFAYLSLPFTLATAASLFLIFAGSMLCWKNTVVAEIAIFISLFVSEFVLFIYFPWLLVPFIIIDVLVILAFSRLFYSRE